MRERGKTREREIQREIEGAARTRERIEMGYNRVLKHKYNITVKKKKSMAN